MLKIGITGLHEVDEVWPSIRDGMAKACKRSATDSGFTPGELWQMCRSGRAFLILVFDENKIFMSSIWEFQSMNGTPVFRCLMMTGKDMKSWIDDARRWVSGLAAENGAKALVSRGRRGWLRVFGAEETSTGDYVLEIDHGR